MSKVYEKLFQLEINGINHVVHYTPAESDNECLEETANWRGPIWFL